MTESWGKVGWMEWSLDLRYLWAFILLSVTELGSWAPFSPDVPEAGPQALSIHDTRSTEGKSQTQAPRRRVTYRGRNGAPEGICSTG